VASSLHATLAFTFVSGLILVQGLVCFSVLFLGPVRCSCFQGFSLLVRVSSPLSCLCCFFFSFGFPAC
jgi:hypothetical protein